MTIFQKWLIASLIFVAAAIFYFAYQLTIPKPTVTERCFRACKESSRLQACQFLNDLTNEENIEQYLLDFKENSDKCDEACIKVCKYAPVPELFGE